MDRFLTRTGLSPADLKEFQYNRNLSNFAHFYYKADVERTREAIAARTKRNLARLDDLVDATSAVTRLHLEGGWYATLRLPHLGSFDWAIALLEKDAVYVHPGAFFGFADEMHVVLSLLTPEETFAEGARRIVSRVARMVEAG